MKGKKVGEGGCDLSFSQFTITVLYVIRPCVICRLVETVWDIDLCSTFDSR